MIPAVSAGPTDMSKVRCHISISLDGFVAGPNQSLDNPLGEGGERLHEWAFATEGWRRPHGVEGGERTPDSDVIDDVTANVGAYIMGRNMFGGGPGGWDPEWRGWWGEDPPFHVRVYVLTRHVRGPLPMHGGTTFEFVTDGIEAALGARPRVRRRQGRRDRRRRPGGPGSRPVSPGRHGLRTARRAATSGACATTSHPAPTSRSRDATGTSRSDAGRASDPGECPRGSAPDRAAAHARATVS